MRRKKMRVVESVRKSEPAHGRVIEDVGDAETPSAVSEIDVRRSGGIFKRPRRSGASA